MEGLDKAKCYPSATAEWAKSPPAPERLYTQG